MAFRDDREALRQRIQELRDEADRLTRERDEGRAAIAEVHRDFDGRVKAEVRQRLLWPMIVAGGISTRLVVTFAVGWTRAGRRTPVLRSPSTTSTAARGG